jgi:prophage regulatory protein
MDEGLFTKPVKIGARSACHPVHEVEAILGARLNGATDEQIRRLVTELHEKRKDYLPESMRTAAVPADAE